MPVNTNTAGQPNVTFSHASKRGQESQPDELGGGIDGDARGPLALAEPGGGDAVVDQEAGYLEQPDRHAQDDQHHQAGGQPEAERGDRPQQDGDGIQHPRMHAIDQPAAGDLQRRVGPAERREHHAELHRVQAELAGDARRGDRQVAAVEVVDHHGNEQQRHDQEAAAGGCHHGSRRGRRRRLGEGHVGFRHGSTAGYRCRWGCGKSGTMSRRREVAALPLSGVFLTLTGKSKETACVSPQRDK